MAEEMKVEIVSRETIKPSSPTPPNLKTYNLSLFDQIAPNVYGSVLYFYSAVYEKDDGRSYDKKIDNISKSLKSSLSKALTRFYPFAGRLSDNGTSIECYDEGAIFIEARVHGVMASVLEHCDHSVRKKFILSGKDPEEGELQNHLIQVQCNFFDCGGLVIGLSTSHKLTDAASMSVFIKAWSNPDIDIAVDFSMPTSIPVAVNPSSLPRITIEPPSELYDMVEKRYVFHNCKISLLKEKATCEGVNEPTRVECVSSLLWKCLISAASRSRNGVERRPSMIIQAVNLRTRTIPPLPLNTIGNMLVNFFGTEDDQTKTNLRDLIMNIRKGLHNVCKKAENGFVAEEFFKKLKEEAELFKKYESYRGTCWCRFPLYEIDFGFGKPTWVCPALKPVKNVFLMMDTKDGSGIELWCVLSEEFIALLEQDEEFLTFASLI